MFFADLFRQHLRVHVLVHVIRTRSQKKKLIL